MYNDSARQADDKTALRVRTIREKKNLFASQNDDFYLK